MQPPVSDRTETAPNRDVWPRRRRWRAKFRRQDRAHDEALRAQRHDQGAPITSHRFTAPLISIVVYLVVAVSLCRHYLYEIDPDSIAYLSIAQKYAAGQFRDAIN